jgi:hemolysin III
MVSHERKESGLRDPFSAISHYLGAGLAVVGTGVLLVVGGDSPLALASFAFYGLAMIFLYLASAIYHTVRREIPLLQQLDHSAIYLMIAGTYTPLCLVAIGGVVGWGMFAAQIVLAAIGIGATFLFDGGPKWLRLVLYLVMGWMVAFAMGETSVAIGPVATAWLVAGGVTYTLGCVVYATKWPKLWPGSFGSHDLWHIFVLGGSVCHWITLFLVAQGG